MIILSVTENVSFIEKGATAQTPLPTESLSANEVAPSEKEDATFEELFQNFSSLKVQCDSMSPTSRRKYAEDMTIAFWKAMNGDDEEIAGLDSSDDET